MDLERLIRNILFSEALQSVTQKIEIRFNNLIFKLNLQENPHPHGNL